MGFNDRARVTANKDGVKFVLSYNDYKRGTGIIKISDGREVVARSQTSIECDGKHYEHAIGAFVNHSCDPSCIVLDGWLVSKRRIMTGEELTIDYDESETEIHSNFRCECGADVCRGYI